MNEISEIAWRVYRDSFKDGENVTIEDSKGDYYWGNLRTNDKKGITLTRPCGRSIDVAWKDIVFISHDGFPFEEINKMSREEAEQRANQQSTQLIRDTLDKITKLNKKNRKEYSRRIGGGCPFVYGPFAVVDLLNPGNNGPNFWGEDDEEVLILESYDGAKAHSFDLSHLFMFDGATL